MVGTRHPDFVRRPSVLVQPLPVGYLHSVLAVVETPQGKHAAYVEPAQEAAEATVVGGVVVVHGQVRDERSRLGVLRYFDVVVWFGVAAHRRGTELRVKSDERRVVVNVHDENDNIDVL